MADRTKFVKVFTDLPDHRAWMDLDPAHVGLWVLALLYCRRNLTDGHFPAKAVRKWGGTDETAGELLAKHRWHSPGHECGDCPQPAEGDLYLHNFLDHQNSRAEVDELSAKRAKAGQLGGKAKAAKQGAKQDAGNGEANPGTLLPESESEREKDSLGAKAPAKRARQLPDDFKPNDGHLEMAAELGVDLRAEWPQFTDHHRSKGSAMKDWDAALRTWIRNAHKFGRGGKTLQVQHTAPRLTLNQCDTRDPHGKHEWADRSNNFHCMGVTA